MIVLKFGGTSVGSAESLRKAIEIVESVSDRGPIVVVSALSGVTNRLVDAVEAAAAGDLEKAREAVKDIRRRHEEIAWELVMQKADFLESFTSHLDHHAREITTILEGAGLLREVTPRARDKIVAIGEKLSSVLFAYTMMTKKLKGVVVDSETVVVTNETFGGADPLIDETRKAAADESHPAGRARQCSGDGRVHRALGERSHDNSRQRRLRLQRGDHRRGGRRRGDPDLDRRGRDDDD